MREAGPRGALPQATSRKQALAPDVIPPAHKLHNIRWVALPPLWGSCAAFSLGQLSSFLSGAFVLFPLWGRQHCFIFRAGSTAQNQLDLAFTGWPLVELGHTRERPQWHRQLCAACSPFPLCRPADGPSWWFNALFCVLWSDPCTPRLAAGRL